VAHDGPCAKEACAEIEQRYQEAVVRAKQCCPMCAALQCANRVDDSLACPCPTSVNTTAELEAIVTDWRSQGCDLLVWACDAALCPPVSGATCLSDRAGGGVCEDHRP
jgi:hypothetical protein